MPNIILSSFSKPCRPWKNNCIQDPNQHSNLKTELCPSHYRKHVWRDFSYFPILMRGCHSDRKCKKISQKGDRQQQKLRKDFYFMSVFYNYLHLIFPALLIFLARKGTGSDGISPQGGHRQRKKHDRSTIHFFNNESR